jgi:hypothetical protein
LSLAATILGRNFDPFWERITRESYWTLVPWFRPTMKNAYSSQVTA